MAATARFGTTSNQDDWISARRRVKTDERTTAEKYGRELLGSILLTVYGHVERVETKDVPVIHVIAAKLIDHSPMLGRLAAVSRDFN